MNAQQQASISSFDKAFQQQQRQIVLESLVKEAERLFAGLPRDERRIFLNTLQHSQDIVIVQVHDEELKTPYGVLKRYVTTKYMPYDEYVNVSSSHYDSDFEMRRDARILRNEVEYPDTEWERIISFCTNQNYSSLLKLQ